MKLNDPFGRMAIKQELEYAHLVKSLHQAGIDSPEKAERVLGNVKTRAWVVILATLVTLLLSSLFLGEMKVVVNALAIFFFFWLYATTTKGLRFIRRYMDEELGAQGELQARPAEEEAPDREA